MQRTFPYAINVDWLQVFCHDINGSSLAELYNGNSPFDFRMMPYGTRHFKELYEVFDIDGDKYAIIQRVPHSSVLSSDAAIVQLCNRHLYKPHFVGYFNLFLKNHGFSYKSISRVDVCFDSNHLLNNLKHSNLIKGLMTSKYLKNNQSKVQWSFNSIANVGKPMECNSCAFGSKSSAVSTKMYNKSLEMREVKNKPYIIENWIFNKIDVDKDVWRIEISIKSDASNNIRTDTGEVFRLSVLDMQWQHLVEDVFFSYAKKYFAFKINTGVKNKTRMPDLEIFPIDRTATLRPIRITEEKDSGRADKIFLKKLLSLSHEFADSDEKAWSSFVEVANIFTLSRGLSAWRQQKLEVAKLRNNYDDVHQYFLQSDLKTLFAKLLQEYPEKATEIQDLSDNIINILKS